jgi:hypothetical protein
MSAEVQEKRRRRRVKLERKVQVRLRDEYGDGPDIAHLVNASTTGIAFLTKRQYSLGTRLMLTHPYPDPSDLGVTEQGRVTRVHKLEDDVWFVAVATR